MAGSNKLGLLFLGLLLIKSLLFGVYTKPLNLENSATKVLGPNAIPKVAVGA